MSKDVDFVISNCENFKKILRPPLSNNKTTSLKKDQPSSKTFTISKSFVPEPKSQTHDSLAPELKQLK